MEIRKLNEAFAAIINEIDYDDTETSILDEYENCAEIAYSKSDNTSWFLGQKGKNYVAIVAQDDDYECVLKESPNKQDCINAVLSHILEDNDIFADEGYDKVIEVLDDDLKALLDAEQTKHQK